MIESPGVAQGKASLLHPLSYRDCLEHEWNHTSAEQCTNTHAKCVWGSNCRQHTEQEVLTHPCPSRQATRVSLCVCCTTELAQAELATDTVLLLLILGRLAGEQQGGRPG